MMTLRSRPSKPSKILAVFPVSQHVGDLGLGVVVGRRHREQVALLAADLQHQEADTQAAAGDRPILVLIGLSRPGANARWDGPGFATCGGAAVGVLAGRRDSPAAFWRPQQRPWPPRVGPKQRWLRPGITITYDARFSPTWGCRCRAIHHQERWARYLCRVAGERGSSRRCAPANSRLLPHPHGSTVCTRRGTSTATSTTSPCVCRNCSRRRASGRDSSAAATTAPR